MKHHNPNPNPCMQRSPLVLRQNDCITQWTVYLRLADTDCKFWSVVIHDLLLEECNLLKKIVAI